VSAHKGAPAPELRLLLDEHITPAVAVQLSRHRPTASILTLNAWQRGTYLGAPDDALLAAAQAAGLTLVTYDLRTIPPLLKQWGEDGTTHGGVIFVDVRTIVPNDVGALVRALAQLWDAEHATPWTDRVIYLTRSD
jgi:hypothetical protein